MNEIRAFFTLPEYSDDSPNKINKIGNYCLLPVIYLTRSSIVNSIPLDDSTNHFVYQLKPYNNVTVLGLVSAALLFIPSLILGVLFKGLSYVDQDVRKQHNFFRGLHEQAQKKSETTLEHASS